MATVKMRTARPRPGLAANRNDVPDSTSAADTFDIADRVVAQVDWSLWRAIRRGELGLAVRCRRCRRWLTDPASKRAGIGPRCAVAEAAEVSR